MSARKDYQSFLDKYKNLNSWNKYNNVGTTVSSSNANVTTNTIRQNVDYNNNHIAYTTGPLPTNYYKDDQLAHEVMTRAGPQSIYNRQGFDTTEIGNVQKVYHDSHLQNGDVVNYRINEDADPIRIVKPMNGAVQEQKISVRYLEPPLPPAPAPIIIKERQLPAAPPAPPIVIRQRAKTPPTPPPLIIREKPPTPPVRQEATVIEKVIAAPQPPPRQVIIERIPANPAKPRQVIYEKWLPYREQGERPVIVEKAEKLEPVKAPRNIIIDYEDVRPIVNKRFVEEGVFQTDPHNYLHSSRSCTDVRYVDRITDLPDEYLIRYRNRPYTPKQYQSFTLPESDYMTTIRNGSPVNRTVLSSSQNYQQRPLTSVNEVKKPVGPIRSNGPWNTTYRTSYTHRSFDNPFHC